MCRGLDQAALVMRLRLMWQRWYTLRAFQAAECPRCSCSRRRSVAL